MLCEQCHQQEAHIFLTQILNGEMSKSALCKDCGANILRPDPAGGDLPRMLADFLKGASQRLAAADGRYTPDAYALVVRAVTRACGADPSEPHVSATAVARAFREVALEEFGTQARPTLAGWGLHGSEDIGNIVFQLVATGALGNRPEERAEDFSGLYDFATAFPTAA